MTGFESSIKRYEARRSPSKDMLTLPVPAVNWEVVDKVMGTTGGGQAGGGGTGGKGGAPARAKTVGSGRVG